MDKDFKLGWDETLVILSLGFVVLLVVLGLF